MTKILIAGGDSFTFGSELPDCTPTVHSQLTWAALLAKQKNLNYKCVAKEGCGNSSIMRRVIDAVENNKNQDVFVAVMWTWPGRIEIKVNEYVNNLNVFKTMPSHDIVGGWIDVSIWNSMNYDDRIKLFPADAKSDSEFLKNYKNLCEFEKKIGLNDLARNYFSLASNDNLLYQSALNVFTLQCYLEKKGIDYIFAATTDHLLEMFEKTDIPFVNLINKTKWLNLDKGMYQWALEKNYKISAMNHPVSQAHEDWLNVHYKH